MDRATTPLFLDYTAWRSQNEDLAIEIEQSFASEPVQDCECIGLSKFSQPFDDCDECDGTGEIGGDAKRETELEMRRRYEQQLEHDHRLAVHCILAWSVQHAEI